MKIDSDLSAQIYALREQRSLTQEDLGRRANMAQSRIAKLESSCEGVSLATLKRLASACDVALSVRFVSHRELVRQAVRENLDDPIPTFPDDIPPVDEFNVNIRLPTTRRHFDSPNVRTSRSRLTDYTVASGVVVFKEKFSWEAEHPTLGISSRTPLALGSQIMNVR
jgi:transcriptional regulator with XRE-family HTH domain